MGEKKKSAQEEAQRLAMLDKRVLERMIQRGALQRTDVEAQLKALPDLENQADNISDKILGN